jgi:hypothetical protein
MFGDRRDKNAIEKMVASSATGKSRRGSMPKSDLWQRDILSRFGVRYNAGDARLDVER